MVTQIRQALRRNPYNRDPSTASSRLHAYNVTAMRFGLPDPASTADLYRYASDIGAHATPEGNLVMNESTAMILKVAYDSHVSIRRV